MDRRKTGTTSVQSEQHVKRLGTPDLPHNDPVGALTQRLTHEIPQRDLSPAIEPGIAGLHLGEVGQVDVDLEHFLARHNPLHWRDLLEEAVDERRLSCTGCTRDENGGVGGHCISQQRSGLMCQCSSVHKI